jgi:transcriptional regulator with XRE-family HTH domain
MRFWNKPRLDAKTLGNLIRQARERQGLSQEDFAVLISRDQRAVSEYENGKRRIAVTDLPTFAEALGVPVIYFYGGTIDVDELDHALLTEFHRLSTHEAKLSAIKILQEFSSALERGSG